MTLNMTLSFFYSYLALGGLFGLYFVGWGAARLDPVAHQLSWSVRLLLWPASLALWPVLLLKLLFPKP
jgi:hypothetical protein